MIIYHSLFFMFFNLIKKGEEGLTFQLRDNRAITSVGLLSLFETLNAMSLLENSKRTFWIAYLTIFVLNMIYFYPNRYKKIIANFSKIRPTKTVNVIVILYLCLTILIFGLTR